TSRMRIFAVAGLALLAAQFARADESQTAQPEPYAQTVPVESKAPEEPVPKDEADKAPRLRDVVVTATKRREETREVPISLKAFRGDDVEKKGATGVEQSLLLAPGVNLNKNDSSDNSYVSMRGVSADSRNNITTRPTGLFLEDAALSNPSTLSV